MGGGQLRVGPGAPGLYAAELRGPGQPSAQVTTADDLAVLDLRSPSQRGVLARNRGNDWRVQLNTSLAWQLDVSAGAVTADLDLRALNLRRVTFQSGVSRLAVRLGDPAAEVPVDLQLSTGLVDLYLPSYGHGRGPGRRPQRRQLRRRRPRPGTPTSGGPRAAAPAAT